MSVLEKTRLRLTGSALLLILVCLLVGTQSPACTFQASLKSCSTNPYGQSCGGFKCCVTEKYTVGKTNIPDYTYCIDCDSPLPEVTWQLGGVSFQGENCSCSQTKTYAYNSGGSFIIENTTWCADFCCDDKLVDGGSDDAAGGSGLDPMAGLIIGSTLGGILVIIGFSLAINYCVRRSKMMAARLLDLPPKRDYAA